MLRITTDLEDFSIGAADGKIGHVKDFYFDDKSWAIRYLVVDSGEWLMSRKVLISPIAIGEPDWAHKTLPVSQTREQVKNSPDIDTDRPVSRQHEVEYAGYYGYPFYWGGEGMWGGGPYPNMLLPGSEGFGSSAAARTEADAAYAKTRAAKDRDEDPHLRSCNEVKGYHIHASDGDIGRVKAMLVDDQSWAIRYLIVEAGHWWDGHKVVISPSWIKDVSWNDSSITVNVTRQAVKDAPTYDPAVTLDRPHEEAIHRIHKLNGYWDR